MPREGRELEKLVEKLETELADKNVEIKSPDYIPDRFTARKREVDISLRGKIGTHELLIIIETRDRNETEDVRWIEQIITKRDDIRANKAIAVSSFGFSDGAIAKAQANSIELRTLEEINSETIKSWFLLDSMHFINRKFDIRSAIFINESLNEEDRKRLEDFINSLNGQFPEELNFILDVDMVEPMSLGNLLLSADLSKFYECIPPDCKEKNLKITLIPKDKDFGFQIITDENSEPIKIESIFIQAILYIEHNKLPIKHVKEYKNSDQTHATIINFGDIEISGDKRSVEMHRFLDGDSQKFVINLNKKD